MSCEVKYIKENYSQHPDYQRLTDTYHAGMKELVSSKLFEEKNDKLKWAKEGTSSRIKQNKLAQSVENQYNVLVQENKGNVVVNISPLINQNNNSSEIKPGVEEVFNSSPELANIGSKEEYSQYLDTIFPDSKIAEIDNSLYISVLEDLKSNKIIEKQCS